MVDANKALPDPSSKNIMLQSLISEDTLKFLATSNVSENTSQSTIPIIKGSDQSKMIIEAEINPIQGKTEPEVQVLNNISAQKSSYSFISTFQFKFQVNLVFNALN